MKNIFQKKDGFYWFNWKKAGLFLVGVIVIVMIGLITNEPEFQRECVLFSEGVWSNTCLG